MCILESRNWATSEYISVFSAIPREIMPSGFLVGWNGCERALAKAAYKGDGERVSWTRLESIFPMIVRIEEGDGRVGGRYK